MMISQERLKEVLDYDHDTGIFRWKVKTLRSKMNIGDIAGYIRADGYIAIRIDLVKYPAHKLAWLFVHGAYPKLIDHKDVNKANNRINNLRLATPSQNRTNTRVTINNKIGYKGAVFHKRDKKWISNIKVNGKSIHLGYFDNPLDANDAYVRAAAVHYGDFSRDR